MSTRTHNATWAALFAAAQAIVKSPSMNTTAVVRLDGLDEVINVTDRLAGQDRRAVASGSCPARAAIPSESEVLGNDVSYKSAGGARVR